MCVMIEMMMVQVGVMLVFMVEIGSWEFIWEVIMCNLGVSVIVCQEVLSYVDLCVLLFEGGVLELSEYLYCLQDWCDV